MTYIMLRVCYLHFKKTDRSILENLKQMQAKLGYSLIPSSQQTSADVVIFKIVDDIKQCTADIQKLLANHKIVLGLNNGEDDDPFVKLFSRLYLENYYSHQYSSENLCFVLFDFLSHIQKERRRKGKLIVIDGGDGSGKGTQSVKLMEYLQQAKIPAKLVDFPQYYNSFYGRVVARFLRGEFGSLASVSPYLASFPYASDRASVKGEMDEYLQNGGYIIANRYATSNLAHQSAKFTSKSEAEKYLQWDYELEYKINKIPKENIVLYLYVPWQIGLELTAKKSARKYLGERKQDIAEEDKQHRIDAEKIYLQLCQRFEHWVQINCVENGRILSIEMVHQKILDTLRSKAII